MAHPFTVEVTRRDGSTVTYALTSHTVRLRGGRKTTVYYFQEAAQGGLAPVGYRLVMNETPRIQVSIGQLTLVARALVTMLDYTPEQAADFVAGFWSEPAGLRPAGIRSLRRELLRKLRE